MQTDDERRDLKRARKRAWNQANADHVRLKQAEWRNANRERYRELARNHYARNRDVIGSRNKAYREARPELTKARRRDWDSRNKYYRLDGERKRKYGVTLEQFVALFEKQGGRCAICESTITLRGRHTHLDHCHATGRVRGVLCRNCNQMLGFAKDDIERMRKGILYLKKHRK